ncbi:hypothetical protein SLEP1_g58455 [Rubroshorea leprosula]|uniref:Uncharacterized protein n=1 Tax=Rubroshorea leprosula TaxID=152421 RepID=A0AAV5MPB8_9ROSI|nr:hypothetical protein SLEP1_g58455 [Rubroshorea leprosula]
MQLNKKKNTAKEEVYNDYGYEAQITKTVLIAFNLVCFGSFARNKLNPIFFSASACFLGKLWQKYREVQEVSSSSSR